MDFETLIKLAEKNGYTVQWAHVTKGYNGATDTDKHTIYLDTSLGSRPRHAVSVLAHELGHITLGHHGHQDEAGERAANEWAAQLLINSQAYELYEQMFDCNVSLIAQELGVSQTIVEAYRRRLARIH